MRTYIKNMNNEGNTAERTECRSRDKGLIEHL